MHPLILAFAILSGSAVAPPAPSDITGAVSPLLPNLCRPLEGEADVLRCAGLVGTDVFLKGPEEARAVALARPDIFLEPPPGGARLGRSVSWRLLGDRPVAAILRYRVPPGADPAPDVLVIVKPARGGEPGCAVGAIEEAGDPAGTAADRAAAFADRRVPLFRCGRDEPVLDGLWSAEGRARTAAWLGAAK